MMNPEIKQKWIEALESGKYEQTFNSVIYLRNTNNKYSMWGVLLDILYPNDWQKGANYYSHKQNLPLIHNFNKNLLDKSQIPILIYNYYNYLKIDHVPFSIVAILLRIDPNL